MGGLGLDFGFAEVFSIEVAVIALLALGAFFRFTRSGVAVRAMAENTERAALLGISVGRLSTITWALAGLRGRGPARPASGLARRPGRRAPHRSRP